MRQDLICASGGTRTRIRPVNAVQLRRITTIVLCAASTNLATLACLPPIVASAATRPAFTERSYLTFRVFRPTSTFQWHIAEPRLSWHILAGVSALTHLHPFTRGMAACSKFCKAIIGQRTSTFARSIIYSR